MQRQFRQRRFFLKQPASIKGRKKTATETMVDGLRMGTAARSEKASFYVRFCFCFVLFFVQFRLLTICYHLFPQPRPPYRVKTELRGRVIRRAQRESSSMSSVAFSLLVWLHIRVLDGREFHRF